MVIALYNSVLKVSSEVTEAKKNLKALNLFPHHDPYKSWDTYKMIEIIKEADKNSCILDIGCKDSPILAMLKKLGFNNLYGCDLLLKPRYNHYLMNIAYSFYRREYKPILDMYGDNEFKLSVQNLQETSYQNSVFDYITSLSVIEHGIDIGKYFMEMSRILKNGGLLLTSTDYWPDKINNTKRVWSKDTPDNIFDRDEIDNLIKVGEKYGFRLIEPIDYTCGDKLVHWKDIALSYTFIFFALRKKQL